jgi:alpha-ketoglutaric semialdehyde dehydrogenase
MLNGNHLIAGEWVGSDETFGNTPINGPVDQFAVGTSAHVDAAVRGAEQAFLSYGYSSRAERAKFLREIATEIEARGDEITAIGIRETGLPEMRLNGERGRAAGQFRLLADYLEAGDYLDRRHDEALPDREPLPRPDLRLMQRPIGPVAVFGASNFPLAFSTAGGDTAAALAAGCPVVVRGHTAHPGISDLICQALHAAIEECGVHPGVFSQIQGGDYAVGQALVNHPLIRAVGFTGSLAGGRALYDICAARDEPIPFYGELGSVNPMFLLPEALSARGNSIAAGWAGSLTMGAGQFCTNPGIAVMIGGAAADAFAATATGALGEVDPQDMLTEGIASAFSSGMERIKSSSGVHELLSTSCDCRRAAPYLYQTTGKEWLANPSLGEEVFGPLGMIVVVDDAEEMITVANALQGQLTCTLHLDDADTELARSLMPVLERKAGRILANGFPTGVEVCDSMVHGGPYPASTNFGATSVGTMSIRRFLRPVSYQNIPAAILPADLA